RSGQYGRLYLASGSHARGKTFHIYVLPRDEKAIENANNGPLNTNAVEVYGITGGQPGWTETYGWLKQGPWQQDFYKLVAARKAEVEAQLKDEEKRKAEIIKSRKERDEELLRNY